VWRWVCRVQRGFSDGGLGGAFTSRGRAGSTSRVLLVVLACGVELSRCRRRDSLRYGTGGPGMCGGVGCGSWPPLTCLAAERWPPLGPAPCPARPPGGGYACRQRGRDRNRSVAVEAGGGLSWPAAGWPLAGAPAPRRPGVGAGRMTWCGSVVHSGVWSGHGRGPVTHRRWGRCSPRWWRTGCGGPVGCPTSLGAVSRVWTASLWCDGGQPGRPLWTFFAPCWAGPRDAAPRTGHLPGSWWVPSGPAGSLEGGWSVWRPVGSGHGASGQPGSTRSGTHCAGGHRALGRVSVVSGCVWGGLAGWC